MVESGELVTSLRSAEGLRQGDVLSSLLFSHTVLPLYSSVSSEFPQVSAVAIMDDVEFVGPFPQLLMVLDMLVQHSPTFGLSLQSVSAPCSGPALHLSLTLFLLVAFREVFRLFLMVSLF